MKIGLLGFGVVGRGVYEITENRDDMQVTKVLCLEDIKLPDAQAVHNIRDIVEDDSIDTVVEAMGGLHPSYDFVSAALKAGKHVVTANKALIAAYYQELTELAKAQGKALLCTAAVGGGIPWLTSLSRASELDEIKAVEGILNGTTNYMLSAMTNSGADYAPALRKAQELGVPVLSEQEFLELLQ